MRMFPWKLLTFANRVFQPSTARNTGGLCMKYVAVSLALLLLAAMPAVAQFPAQGDDLTTSLGSFQIQVTNNFAGLFAGCPGYTATTQILKSPTLYDPATLVGRSNVINDGDNNDV